MDTKRKNRGGLRFSAIVLLLARIAAAGDSSSFTPAIRLDADPAHRATPAVCGGFASGSCLVPRGFAPLGREFHLETVAGGSLVCRCEPVGVYADGSARALRIDAQIPRDLATRPALLRLREGPPREPLARLDVRDDKARVRIETAGIAIDIPRDGDDLLGRIQRDGVVLRREFGVTPAADPKRHARVVAHGPLGETTSDGAPRSVRIVESGPLRAVVDVNGLLLGSPLAYRLRFTFRAGVPVIDLRFTITPMATARFTDIAFELPFAGPRPLHARFLGADARDFLLDEGERAEVLALDGQRLVGVRVSKRAKKSGASSDDEAALDSALRCGVAFDAGRIEIAAVGSRLRPLDPRGLSISGNGTLGFSLLRSEEYVADGTPLVVDLSLGLFFASEAAEGVASLVREPLPALRGGDGAVVSLALPYWSPLAAAERDAADPLGKLLACVDSAVSRLHGRHDYGDYRLGRGFANLEYDPQLAFGLAGLAPRADARHALIARDMVNHFILCDLSRGESGLPDGVPFLHGDEHRTLEFEPGHVFVGGIVLSSLLGLDADVDAAAARVDAALGVVANEAGLFTHERDYGWMLVALADVGVLFGDQDHASERERLAKDLIGTQAPRGFFAIDRRDPRETGGGAFVPSPWVTAGITFEALYRLSVIGTTFDVSKIVRRGLDFLLVDARYENGEFAARVAYDRAGEVVVEQNGVADPVDRLMIAAGIGRAALMLNDAAAFDLFDREVTLAATRLKSLPLSGNDAARALVAWRSIADTRVRRTEH